MAMPINLLIISTLALHVPSTRGEREHGNEDSTNALSLELLSQGACGEPSCVEWCDDLPFPGKGTEIKFFYAEWCPCAQQIFALLKGLNKLEAWFARVELKCISSLADKGKGKEYAQNGLIDPNNYGASTSKCEPWHANRDAEHPYGKNSVWEELGDTDSNNTYARQKEKAKDPSMKYHMHPAIVIEGKKYVGTPVITAWLQKHSKDIPLTKAATTPTQPTVGPTTMKN